MTTRQPYKPPCAVRGCDNPRYGHGAHCNAHYKKLKRYGHPEQSPVSHHELKPYAEEVRRFFDERPDTAGWVPLGALIETVAGRIRGELTAMMRRGACSRWRRQALRELANLLEDESVSVVAIVSTIGGLYLLQERRPLRFRDEDAFRCHLTRRLRGLSISSRGVVPPKSSADRTKIYTRDIPRRVALEIGDLIAQSLGAVLLRAIKVMHEQYGRENDARNSAYSALGPGALQQAFADAASPRRTWDDVEREGLLR